MLFLKYNGKKTFPEQSKYGYRLLFFSALLIIIEVKPYEKTNLREKMEPYV